MAVAAAAVCLIQRGRAKLMLQEIHRVEVTPEGLAGHQGGWQAHRKQGSSKAHEPLSIKEVDPEGDWKHAQEGHDKNGDEAGTDEGGLYGQNLSVAIRILTFHEGCQLK